jgi:hypothetical protein
MIIWSQCILKPQHILAFFTIFVAVCNRNSSEPDRRELSVRTFHVHYFDGLDVFAYQDPELNSVHYLL